MTALHPDGTGASKGVEKEEDGSIPVFDPNRSGVRGLLDTHSPPTSTSVSGTGIATALASEVTAGVERKFSWLAGASMVVGVLSFGVGCVGVFVSWLCVVRVYLHVHANMAMRSGVHFYAAHLCVSP